MYSPIMSCKLGEKRALSNLQPYSSNLLRPIICVDNYGSSFDRFTETLDNAIKRNLFYLYLHGDILDEDPYPFTAFESLTKQAFSKRYIPTIDIANHYLVEDLKDDFSNGLALRVRANDFEDAFMLISFLCDKYSLECKDIDVILDFGGIKEDELFTAKVLAKEFFKSEIVSSLRSVIVSSTSFPHYTDLSHAEAFQVLRLKRLEPLLFDYCKSISNNSNLIYSDYGPFGDISISYIIGMSPNFKIRYTSKVDYLYIRGIQTSKGGLEFDNVKKCCDAIVNAPEYRGKDFSWGDDFINQISENNDIKPGNLTTWVSISWNHHITSVLDIE